jgi:hypothetical protein
MSTAVQEPRVAQSHFNMARADISRLDEKGLGSKRAGNAKPVHPDSQWKTTEVVPLTRESFLDMLDGKTPLIKEAKFIPEQMNKKLAEELSPKLCPYLHATGPAVHKVGLAQFEFQAQSQEDFKTRSGEGMMPRILFRSLGAKAINGQRNNTISTKSRSWPLCTRIWQRLWVKTCGQR